MTRHYLKWCPNKCGKKVVLFQKYNKYLGRKTLYKCRKCEKVFTKEELKGLNNFRKTKKELREEKKEQNEKDNI